ncbi:MAG: hypothetical protein ACR2HH_17200 [Chthoniobacterales bacterium]
MSATRAALAKSVKNFLTPASSEPPETITCRFVEAHADVYGLNDAQAKQLIKFADYNNPAGNLSFVEFRQEFNGIAVFQGEILTVLDPQSRSAGWLTRGLTQRDNSV